MEEAQRILYSRTQLRLGSSNGYAIRAIAGRRSPTVHPDLPADGPLQPQGDEMTGPDVAGVDDEVDLLRPDTQPEQTGISQAIILYPGREEELDEDADGLDTEEIVQVERTILGTLDPISDGTMQDIWEDLRSTLRKVVRYAVEVHEASTKLPGYPTASEPRVAQAVPFTEHIGNDIPGSGHDISAGSENGGGPLVYDDGDVHLVIPSHQAANMELISNSRGGFDFMNVKHRNNSRSPSPEPRVAEGLFWVKNIDGKTWSFPFNAVRRWGVSAFRDVLITAANRDRMLERQC